MNLDHNLNHFFTLEEFERIQKEHINDRVEYSNGEILLSSNTSRRHNKIIRKLILGIGTFFDETKCEIYNEQIEVVFKNQGEIYKYKPDLFIVCDETIEDGESITSVPKIIFEVVSENYEHYDYFIKLRTYEKFGVLEYNIVNQYGNIIQYVLEGDKYVVNKSFHKDETYISSVFNDLKIELNNVFRD